MANKKEARKTRNIAPIVTISGILDMEIRDQKDICAICTTRCLRRLKAA